MKRLLLLLLALPALALAQKPTKNTYQFALDLTQVQNDQLQVSLIPPTLKGPKAIYRMPKVIPGTYADFSLGRFVSNFKALDAAGNPLTVTKLDENNWEISNANKLAKVTYTVDDSWDTPNSDRFIFEPGGAGWERDSAFVWNASNLFGYFDNLKVAKYRVQVTKPAGFYGSTSMVATTSTATQDVWEMPNYMDLVDAPVLYCRPDTTVMVIGGSEILVSVYNASKKVTSKPIAADIRRVIEAAKDYLGGTLPVKKYAFLIYVSPKGFQSGSYGALEHSYSSLYTLLESSPEVLGRQVRDVAAHEFYHVVTPLNIHAEQIGDFDYTNPKMSEHLWLYEGVTEYNAHISQVRAGIIDEAEFVKIMTGKMKGNDNYKADTLSFTKMSSRIIEPAYNRLFGNVYQKGALIAMGLDIHLRKWSNGKYGVNTLLADLSKTYGKNKSFKDAELFDKIAKLTYPEIKTFFLKYVAGTDPMPYGEWLAMAGITYKASESTMVLDHGMPKGGVGFNPATKEIFIANLNNATEVTQALGLQKGDALLQFNGQPIELSAFQAKLASWKNDAKEGDDLSWTVGRNNAAGQREEVVLRAKARKIAEKQTHLATITPSPTPEQAALRRAWLHQ